MKASLCAAALAACLSLSASEARAQQKERVEWDPSWRCFQWYNYAATAGMLAASIGLGLGTPFQEDGHRGGVLFDDAVREAFMLRTRRSRDYAKALGDRLYQGSIIFPHIVDSLLVAGIAHNQWAIAGQMSLIDLQSQSLAALLSLATEHFVGRARPSTEPCEVDPQYERYCDASDKFGSFISGHTAMAMTTAGLMCAHHSKMPLYGGGAPDVVACATGIVLASTTGVMRMINDRHYATDIITGAAVGTFAGYVVPMVLHYGFGDGPLAGQVDARIGGVRMSHAVMPIASREQLGASWMGLF